MGLNYRKRGPNLTDFVGQTSFNPGMRSGISRHGSGFSNDIRMRGLTLSSTGGDQGRKKGWTIAGVEAAMKHRQRRDTQEKVHRVMIGKLGERSVVLGASRSMASPRG